MSPADIAAPRDATAPREHRVAVESDVELRVLTRNHGADGTPFVLVHGLASNAHLWDGVAESLAAAGHPVASVDQRGHGRSSKPDHGYDFATVTADLVAVIDALGFRRPVVAGQSWGGNVVVELAATRPESVAGVVAVDGGFIELGTRFDDWEECRTVLAPPRLIGTPLEVIESHMRRAHPRWPESGIRGALANFDVRPDGTIAPWLTLDRHLMILRALFDHRPSTLFPTIMLPVLLVPADTGDVAWTHDKREAVDAALAALPHGDAHWFSPADHDIHAQHPEPLAEVLRSFAARITSKEQSP
ncbi:MAG: alpha/beta fold hydrolase [Ilumatobacteraceae bacterium]